jgi:hypothetical protein
MGTRERKARFERWTAKDIIDRTDKLIDAFTKIGVAYTGFNATGHWTGALIALVGLRLAEANNLASGVAGVATLTALGLGNIYNATATEGQPNRIYLPPP